MDLFPSWAGQVLGRATVDIGNALVAISTLVLAFISLFIAGGERRRAARSRVADLRTQWLDKMRDDISRFVGSIDRCSNYAVDTLEADSESQKSAIQAKFSEINAEIRMLETSLIIRLNPNEDVHYMLSECIKHARGNAGAVSVHCSRERIEILRRLTIIIAELSRVAFFVEWYTVKLEIEGNRKSCIKRKITKKYGTEVKSANQLALALLEEISPMIYKGKNIAELRAQQGI